MKNIKKLIPDCAISHDMIVGFPNESDEDHNDTVSLMKEVVYSFEFIKLELLGNSKISKLKYGTAAIRWSKISAMMYS